MPERFRAPDGTSQFAPASSWKFTTAEVLQAEARLLDGGRDSSGPKVSYGAVVAACQGPCRGGLMRSAPTRSSQSSRWPPPGG